MPYLNYVHSNTGFRKEIAEQVDNGSTSGDLTKAEQGWRMPLRNPIGRSSMDH